jgi:hypothetical protein
MRFSSAVATSLFVAAVFAFTGCGSNLQTSQSLPAGGPLGTGPISQAEVLKLQLAGKLHSIFPRKALLHALEMVSGHSRPHLSFRRTSSVSMWVSDQYYSYVIGTNGSGKQVVTAIDTQQNGCLDPSGIKVDPTNNLWVACTFNSAMTNGVVQEYKPGSSTPYATFSDAGCNSPCTSFNASAQDVAFDSNGHVFAADGDSNECSPSCTNPLVAAVWWPAGSPNSVPTPIEDPNITTFGGFLDVDSSGNLYMTGQGCIATACGYLLDEIENPTSASATVTNLVPPSYSADLYGVYVSDRGTVLNVTDGLSRKTSQYHLPWTGVVFNTLGPTLLNLAGYGQPYSGGFNYGEKRLALGDAWGWVDIGRVATNSWSAATNIDINSLNVGAAFVPSDKQYPSGAHPQSFDRH